MKLTKEPLPTIKKIRLKDGDHKLGFEVCVATDEEWAASDYIPGHGELIAYWNGGQRTVLKLGDGIHIADALPVVNIEGSGEVDPDVAIQIDNAIAIALQVKPGATQPVDGAGELFNDYRPWDPVEGSMSNAGIPFIDTKTTGNRAEGEYSHVEGTANLASGARAHAEGKGNQSIGQCAHTEGSYNIAKEKHSHAEGNYTIAEGYASHAEGTYSHTNRNASAGHAEGTNTVVLSIAGHAEGEWTKAEGQAAHAEGSHTVAQGQNSHSEGRGTVAANIGSHAEGLDVLSSGRGSHGEGLSNQTTGDGSHVEGDSNQNYAGYAHVEGSHNIVDSGAPAGHAEGISNHILHGRGSHAEGLENQIEGEANHAEGHFNQVTGEATHVGGYSSSANGFGQFIHGVQLESPSDVPGYAAIGKGNIASSADIFVVGNGRDTTAGDIIRKNAFAVKLDGTATIQKQGITDDAVVRLDTLKQEIEQAIAALRAELKR